MTEGKLRLGVLRYMVYLINAIVSCLVSHTTRSGDKENVEKTWNIPCILCFMSADESEQPIPIQELADSIVP